MKNYIKFLEETKVGFTNTIGDFTFYKRGNKVTIKCNLECKYNHLQPLKEIGIKFDFSNKKVGFAHNQIHTGNTGNTLRIACSMDLSVFTSLAEFLRNDFRANLMNDQQLTWRGFKLKTKQSYVNVPKQENPAVKQLKQKIRVNVHNKKYSKEIYSLPLIQKTLNK